ncbi:MAG TPA: hypothetical protein VFH08_13335 [Chitinophagaceae bacterium]|nr:hypothetical protein [Chitinophagaceae bacterium]
MKNRWKKYRVIAGITVSLVVIACIYGYKQYSRKLADTKTLHAAFNLKATDLLRQFETDEAKATAQYGGQVISVQGIIGSVQATDSSGTVFLNERNSMTSVICQFDSENFQEMRGLQKGELITIKGICSGYLMDVIMVRCVLE